MTVVAEKREADEGCDVEPEEDLTTVGGGYGHTEEFDEEGGGIACGQNESAGLDGFFHDGMRLGASLQASCQTETWFVRTYAILG
jgi:hypothetical protein